MTPPKEGPAAALQRAEEEKYVGEVASPVFKNIWAAPIKMAGYSQSLRDTMVRR